MGPPLGVGTIGRTAVVLVMVYFLVWTLATEHVSFAISCLLACNVCSLLYVRYMLIKFTLQKPLSVLKVIYTSEGLGYSIQ